MKEYVMTDKGKEVFNVIKSQPTRSVTHQVGFRVLGYLHEKTVGNSEDIALDTGIPRKEVVTKLRDYKKQGFLKVIADL